MAYVSLYRRFRPDSFDKVVGQNHIVKTLCNQIKNDRIGHSYLFTGTRGTGKTSCAKIFARAVNCTNSINGSPCNKCDVCKELSKPNNMDIIEIDAASNNGVDEIRQLKENTQYRPAAGKYKVYIIDEVHMLTASAFNALLKTLEEPPEHIIFILATTEVQKLPATILSRCLRFDFRLVPTDEIRDLLCRIFDDIKVKYDKKAVQQIAVFGEGSVRDAISVADMCMSYCDGNITLEGVLEALGASDFNTLHALGKAILSSNSGEALTVLDKLFSDGRNTVHKDLCNYFRDLISIKNIKGYKLNSVTEEEAKLLADLAAKTENYRISRAMEIITDIETSLRYSSQPRILFEATIVKACELRLDTSNEATFTRLKELENKLDALQKNGITINEKIIETKTEENHVEPAKTEVLPKESISEELELNAVAVNDNTIFEEVNDADEEKAYSAWDGVIKKLKERGERTLYVVASEVDDDITMEGNNLIIRTVDNATVKFFNQPNYLRIIKECIKEELGQEYNFLCIRKTEKTEEVKEGINQLKELFGSGLKFMK